MTETINRRRFPILLVTTLALLAILGALFLPDRAQAQTQSEVLVSNVGESGGLSGVINTSIDYRQGIRTGPGSEPHSLTSIELQVDSVPPAGKTLTVTVRSRNSAGQPGGVVATLQPPTSFSTGNNTFTAQANATLAVNTRYFVVVESDSTEAGKPAVALTRSNREEGVPGWEIDNDVAHLKLRVNGTHTGPPYLTDAEVSTDGRSIVLTFSEDLDHPTLYSSAALNAFTVTVDGDANGVVQMGGTDDTVTLQMQYRIGAGQAVVISYDESDAGSQALKDSDDQEVGDFTTGSGGVPDVDNKSTLDTTPPALTAATVAATGSTVTLAFDEDVVAAAGALPTALADAFTVTVDGVERGVTGVTALTRSRVTLTAESAIHEDQTVTVSYDISAAGANALLDDANNDVASFTTGEDGVPAVTNNSTVASAKLVSVTVNAVGTDIALTFDKALNSASTGLADQFTATADGIEKRITGSSGLGSADDNFTLLFSSSAPAYKDEAVVLTYVKPSGSDGLTDQANDLSVASFTTGQHGVPAVTNNSTVVAPPRLADAEVQTSGNEIYLGFSLALEVPATVAEALKDAFTVTVDGEERAFADLEFFGLGDAFVKLVFTETLIPAGASVVVSYDQSDAGTSALEGTTSNKVPDFTTGAGGVVAVTNNSTVSSDATLSGLTVSVDAATGIALETVTLSPSFDPAVEAYTVASVRFDLGAQVTFMPTPNQTGATVAYFDAADMALEDAGTTTSVLDAGHQVETAVGENTVKVKVTAPDKTTKKTYTVTVTRALPTLIGAGVQTNGTSFALEFQSQFPSGTGSLPAGAVAAFTVTADGVEREITGIAQGISEQILNITLSSAIYKDQAVVVSYDSAAAGDDALEDLDGNAFQSFTSGEGGVSAASNKSTQTFPTPSTPTNFTADPGDKRAILAWTAPAATAPVTKHQYRFKTTGEYDDADWTDIPDSGPGGDNEDGYTVTGLDNGTAYTFQLRAANRDAQSTAAESGAVTPADNVPPRLRSALVSEIGNQIFLTFNENLDFSSGSAPPASAFSVSADGVAIAVGDATRGLNAKELWLLQFDSTIYQNQTVTVTYTDPTTGDDAAAIQDAAGNDAVSFTTGEDGVAAVTNNSILSASQPPTPTNFAATAGDGQVTLAWDAPAAADPITRYEYAYKTDGPLFGAWVRIPDSAPGGGHEDGFTVTGLDNGTAYTFGLRAVGPGGNGTVVGSDAVTPKAGASSDATLRALAVNDGTSDLTLTPAFASGTTDYAASAANDVAQVTVTPTVNHAEADVEYLDGDDNELDDADTNAAGHQVALAVGANTVKVKVTAEDTTTTETYTVTVTRAATMTPGTCTLNPGDIWCGVVTVAELVSSGIITGYGYNDASPMAALSDNMFSIGTNDYTIYSIWNTVSTNNLVIELGFALTDDEEDSLELHVGSEMKPFGDYEAESLGGIYTWTIPNLDWSSETSVTLRLREREDPAADATLRALTVTHPGGSVPLDPTFMPNETEYTASVANAVAEVTVAAEANATDATLAYLDGDGAEIADADTVTPGREVALEVGEETLVQVKVTAANGDATRTYRVRVTRRAVDAPGQEGEFRLNPNMEESYEDPDNSRYAGKQSRLEVFHAGRWGTVCSDRFKGSDNDSHPSHGNLAPKLACQAMNYDDGEYLPGYGTSEPHQSEADRDNYLRPGGAYPADGPLPIWLDDVMCWTRADWPFTDDPTPDYGRLMYLENPEDPEDQAMTPYLCAYAGWGLHNGTHREDAGVRCWYVSEQSAQNSERALEGRFLLSPEQHDGSKRVTVKVAFSEPIDETPEGLRNHGVRVEGGEVTAVHREGGQPGAGTRSAGGPASGQVVWVIEIQPTSAEDLTLSLGGGRPCHEAGAICTADGRTLSEGISTTVKGPSSLTASFQDVPGTHDGETPFTFRVAFSEDIDIGLPALREDAFTVTGGTVTEGQRVDDRHDLFEVRVEPNSGGDVTITLPAGRDCSVSGAICTTGKNRRLLSNSPTAKVAGPANAPPTGAPTIRGTAQVGETLTAGITGIADADGLSGETFTYQWVSGDGTADTDIENATGSTYTLADADQGKAIKVRVTFTDGGGNEETLTSAPSGPVWGDGPPGAPRNLTATPGNKEVTLSWDPPADNGNAPATGYRIEWRADGKDYDKTIWGTARSTTYTTNDQANLANGVKYFFRVRAGNGSGYSYGPYGPASGEVSATPTSGSAVDLGTPVLSDTETLHHGMVRLDWEDVEDAGWYVVLYYHVKGGEWLDLPAEGVDIAIHGSSAVVSNLHGLSWLRVRAMSCDGASEWSQIEQSFGTNASDWDGVPVPEVEEGDEIEPCPVVLGTPVLSDTETLHHGMVRLDWQDIEDAGWYVVQYYHVKGGEWVDLPAEGVDIAFHGSSAVVSNLHGLSWLRVRAMSCAGESEWSQIEQSFGTNASDWEGVPVPDVAEGDEIEPCSEDADTPENSPATGAPAISGTTQVGETLTADTSGIADADGLGNVRYEYQWLADDSDISGATNATYTLAAADEGKAIKVRVSFTDDVGNDESLSSEPTAVVAAAPPPSPDNVRAVAQKSGAVELTWDAPQDATVTGYRIERRPASGDHGDQQRSAGNPRDNHTLVEDTGSADTGYTDNTAQKGVGYEYRVSARNEAGAGEESDWVNAEEATAANSPATGAPAISGATQVGETLTADTSGIADADGLGNVQYEYQWLADDSDISGATDATYTLAAADEGKAIKVQVSFTDDADNEEALTSAATDAVAAEPQTNSPATGAPTITGTVQVGETLTANTSGIADADGLNNVRYEYQWLADDSDIAGGSGSTYTLADADEGKAIRVRVGFTDDANNEESLTSTATDAVAAEPQANSPATGAPTVTGTVQVGETLTADTSGIADADGLNNVRYEYQWLADDSEIAGATSLTYTVAAADEGKAIKVEVTFADDAGNDETLTSAATAAVAAAEPSEPPDKPRGLEATSTHDSVTLSWNDPQDESITGYVILRRVRVNDQGGDFSVLVADTGSAATTYTDTTVAASTTYTYRIKAINEHGVSERSRWVHIDTPAPPVPDKPTGLEATASNGQVVLTWDDPQDDSITGYVILRRLPGVDAEGHFDELVADTGTAATAYTDDSVEPETRYTYRIKAINEHGTSERSRWYHIDTPAAP